MRWYDPLLYPIAVLYDGVTRLRNRMFDIGQKRSTVFSIPTVAVGNLSLGGTGKTPMVEFLIELLKKKYKLATLSRGYGRKTKGYILVNDLLGPSETGDEPFQLYEKYKHEIAVAVGEERVLAIPQILIDRPETELILLDDAFQHRYLKADLYILLTTYQKPFFRDRILPLGTLRENASGAERADIIIVTKSPVDISQKEKSDIISGFQQYSRSDCPTFFSGLKYGAPYPVFGKAEQLKHQVILLSGIADDALLKEEVANKYEIVEILSFSDHHHYDLEDVKRLQHLAIQNKDAVIMTTEKDAVKLKDANFHEYLREIPIFAIPIKVDLAAEEQEFIFNQIVKIVEDKDYTREI